MRLRANGDLNSCLKSHRMRIGNIYSSNFAACWNGPLQQDFREKSLAIPKDRGFFKFIGNCTSDEVGCARVCDNVLVNQSMNRFARFIS